MKLSLISFMTLLAIVSTTPIEERAVAQEFNVSGFSAGCVPHGTLCTFNFHVVTDNIPEQTQCNSSFSTAYTLPNVLPTNCVDASISWSFYSVESGANYTLSLADDHDHLSASKVWGKAEFPILDAGSTVYQQYIGAPDFVVK